VRPQRNQTRRRNELESGLGPCRGSRGGGGVRRQRPGETGCDPPAERRVRFGDAGRRLEQRGAAGDRAAVGRAGELRQQVPRRGGRVHGHRPRRDLRRVAIEGGYTPYAIWLTAPAGTSPAAAIATAAYDTLTGLQPQLGVNQSILDAYYNTYLAAIPDGTAKTSGIAIGGQVAHAVLALRANDGREKNPTVADLGPPPSGPGVWQPDPTRPVLGLRLPGIKPLALQSASQFRPDGPNPLTSQEYADDLNQVEQLGRVDSTTRNAEQTTQALFWTDHDIRQWNDGMLRLATARGLDLVQTARMLAMAHVAGGDAMIACFDAKYHYWFWRPYQAIALADPDGNPATVADPTWQPLRSTPNFPEYPSAHACHSTAVVEALDAFFGTDNVPFSLDSRVTGTTRAYDRLQDVVKDIDWARVLVGFHFRNSDMQGSSLGRKVGRYVADNYFQPLG
jgi:hypothetical protein